MRLTQHSQERIINRMQGITTVQEVMEACNAVSELEAYAPVVVKNVNLPGVEEDQVVAVCKNGHIVTVTLRRSWSQSGNYGRMQ